MKPLGVISGTVLLRGKGIFSGLREETVETDFGRATVFCIPPTSSSSPVTGRTPAATFCRTSSTTHANLTALKKLGVREILGIHSYRRPETPAQAGDARRPG